MFIIINIVKFEYRAQEKRTDFDVSISSEPYILGQCPIVSLSHRHDDFERIFSNERDL
jgi:hypothetical protein